jgi:hypothetical protein
MVPSPSTTASSSTVGTSAPESLLIRYIQAHVKKGELANERADQNRQKAEEHFVAAGAYLAQLKTTYAPTWQAWESLLKIKVKLSVGRASELMQIADGRKTVQEVREATAQRVKVLRATSSLQHQCNEEGDPDEIFNQEGAACVATAPPNGRAPLRGPQESNNKADASQLIDALAESTPAVRSAAAEALINGSHQTRFQSVTTAVIDLYQQLSRAGR